MPTPHANHTITPCWPPRLLSTCTARGCLVNLFVCNLFASLLTFALDFSFHPYNQLWEHAGWIFFRIFVFTNCVGTLIGLAFDFTSFGAFLARKRFPVNYLWLAGMLVVMANLGCVIAWYLICLMPDVRPAGYPLSASMLIGTVMALLLGIGGFAYDSLRVRLELTLRQLHERELAEERARKHAAQAQLASLESRIHPHFLFNTLNSIAALVRDDPARAEETIEQLAGLLRFSLDSSRSAVSLAEELRFVSQYLEIEKVRFSGRLQYEFDVRDVPGAQLIPPLAIQTLVENCVKHTVSARLETTSIRVTARQLAGHVEIEVSDDGPGFTEADLRAGHGLHSLRQRLGALFGARGALHIARDQKRTFVTMTLPAAVQTALAGD
ncbi:MAG: sensor histidine kinase [Blastocatellia bacterium]